MERITKGFASHRRLQILFLLKEEPELSVLEIADHLKIGYKNIAEHIRKMSLAGLLAKRHEGAAVRHKLTSRAEAILKFCRTLE